MFINCKKAHGSVKRDVLFNILIEFGYSCDNTETNKMCVSANFFRVRIGKHLSDIPIRK